MGELARDNVVRQFALKVFKHLYEVDSFERIMKYLVKTDNSRISFKDSGEKISMSSLFLISTREEVRKINEDDSHHPRWFDSQEFVIGGKTCFLSGEWNAPESYPLSILKLKSIVKTHYNLSVEKNDNEWILSNALQDAENKQNSPMQKIFFGAPGTGKSHKLDYDLFKDANGNPLGKGLKSVSNDCKFRTTFHPDYDYAQFVGSYKPCQAPYEEKILDADNLQSKAKTFSTGDHDLLKFAALYSKSLSLVDNKQIVVNESTMIGEKNDRSISTQMSNGIAVGNFLKERIAKGSITYSFVPQVFAKAYAAAWENLNQPVYLVIEEINRGNCAQIFGDLFQLLDRNENGFSDYEIEADADFAEWIEMQLDSSAAPQNDIPDEIRSGRKLRLPPNFNILATMNTSDQSLFPMDSAFKRRFDWEYVPIDFEGKDCASYQIKIDDENSYPWQKFVESVNEKIVSITDSEDKQLGEYFIKLNPADNNVITKERFLGKVMFYLWNEVCKDVHKQESFFREEESGRYFTFQDLYKKDGDKKLIKFMEWITAKKEEMS